MNQALTNKVQKLAEDYEYAIQYAKISLLQLIDCYLRELKEA